MCETSQGEMLFTSKHPTGVAVQDLLSLCPFTNDPETGYLLPCCLNRDETVVETELHFL